MVETISIPQDPHWARIVREKAERTVTRHEGCAQSIVAAFMEELGIDEPMVFRVAGAMQGGMLSSLTCGVHTAGMMVLGLLMGWGASDWKRDLMGSSRLWPRRRS